MLNGLSLFTGIGGIDLALSRWVEPICYCESDRYAQLVLFSRMAAGDLRSAPIWDDVRSLQASLLPPVDIISGGFPCQDISVAGAGKGLGGSRSGLFFEILRLCGELRPWFVFLENVPAIAVRGLDRVLLEFVALGYDCRWTTVSAAEVGAPHLRERWFLLARQRGPSLYGDAPHPDGDGVRQQLERMPGRRSGNLCGEGKTQSQHDGQEKSLAYAHGAGFEKRWRELPTGKELSSLECGGETMADAESQRQRQRNQDFRGLSTREGAPKERSRLADHGGWKSEPDVGRVAHGVSARVDRLRGLGNAVVPLQARAAFERLMGLK